jgi:hypothetical protein
MVKFGNKLVYKENGVMLGDMTRFTVDANMLCSEACYGLVSWVV